MFLSGLEDTTKMTAHIRATDLSDLAGGRKAAEEGGRWQGTGKTAGGGGKKGNTRRSKGQN